MKRWLLVAVFLAPTSSWAFSNFQSEVPNGASSSCQTCHARAGGGSPWNAFGNELFVENGAAAGDDNAIDAFADSFIWWNADICNADSDGDGQTNGQELGDPNCEWTAGAAPRSSDLSNPGNATSTSANPDGVDGGDGGDGGDDDAGEPAPSGCGAGSQAAAALPVLALLRRRRR
jgi:hypothetical protein